jgi:hypothetical protein
MKKSPPKYEIVNGVPYGPCFNSVRRCSVYCCDAPAVEGSKFCEECKGNPEVNDD